MGFCAGSGFERKRNNMTPLDEESGLASSEICGPLHRVAGSYLNNAEGGNRTPTPVKTSDFESDASANSATSAIQLAIKSGLITLFCKGRSNDFLTSRATI